MAAHAWMNEYYVVASVNTGPATIYDISGDVLDQSGAWFRNWASADLPMDKRIFEVGGSFHKKLGAIRTEYGAKVEVRWMNTEDWYTLASLDPDLALDDIVSEFELVPKKEDLQNNEDRQDAAR